MKQKPKTEDKVAAFERGDHGPTGEVSTADLLRLVDLDLTLEELKPVPFQNGSW